MTKEMTRTEVESRAHRGDKSLAHRARNTELVPQVREMNEAMSRMAGLIVDMHGQLQALQAKVAMLEKLTPMQVKDVNLRIRERACGLEMEYDLPAGSAEKLQTLIRRQVRMETGARSARDIARCDYPVVCGLIADWEDYGAITRLGSIST